MLKNTLILSISCLVSVLFAEAAVRLVFDPVDYLATRPESDPVLNHRLAPGASGHDDWGYRNSHVPERAEILAIGDSMTYGVMAKSFEAWPARLEDITGKETYSAALGGYGPLHYLHILKTRAPELQPEQVIVMIYPGNDLLDVYNLAYSNDHWQDYRRTGEAEALDPNLFLSAPSEESLTKRIRDWLSRRSVLYRLVSQTPLFDAVRERERLDGSKTSFRTEHLGLPVVLNPERRFRIANADDARIQEALEITTRILKEMADFSVANGIRLQVAIMPVREHVFYGLRDGAFPEGGAAMAQLAASLERIESDLSAALDATGIPWINLRPAMQNALAEASIYPPTDGHPNALGYDVAARVLAAEIGGM